MASDIPSLIFSFIFLAPGYIAFVETLKASKIENDYDKFDKTVYSLVFSGVILSMLYVSYSAYSGSFVSMENLTDIQLGLAFLAHFSLSPIIGNLFGKYFFKWYYWDDEPQRSLAPPFNFFFNKMDDSENYKVRVRMSDGREISGFKIATDDDQKGENQVLKFPRLIGRDSKGEIDSKQSLGKYVYISDDQLSEIYTDEDIVVDGETL